MAAAVAVHLQMYSDSLIRKVINYNEKSVDGPK